MIYNLTDELEELEWKLGAMSHGELQRRIASNPHAALAEVRRLKLRLKNLMPEVERLERWIAERQDARSTERR